MEIQINENAKRIMQTLTGQGFDAVVVGGCVRDAVMGIEPHDWDIASNATPEQVMGIFSHVIPTGIQHGTVTVMIGDEGFEVTTFRADGASSDNRHPDTVEFVSNIIADVCRRDFTMNAMFARIDGMVVDTFRGIEDINNRVINFIGNPAERINEDALRMMRAIRFASRFGFRIGLNSFTAIEQNAGLINRVSAERIRDEIVKTITSKFPDVGIINWHETGMLSHILPEVDVCFDVEQNNPHHIFDVGNHIAMSVASDFINDTRCSLAMLFHDIGKPSTKVTGDDGIDHFLGHGEVSAEMALDIMHRLKFDNSTIEMVHSLVLHHNAEIHPTGRNVRRWLNRVGVNVFKLLLGIRLADADAQNPIDFSDTLDEVNAIWDVFNEVIASQNAFRISDLVIGGKDLIKMGVPQNRMMGAILGELLNIVIENPRLNTREILIAEALRFWQELS